MSPLFCFLPSPQLVTDSNMNSIVAAACEYLHQGFTLLSFILERSLSQVHSVFYTTLSSITKVNLETTATDRAWWDTRKGSAVVIWASGDQSIAQSLAISLASVRAKSGSRRAGRPPYTVIVLLPSNSSGLSSLISSWAMMKARIESGEETSRGRTSWDVLESLRFGSPESHTSESPPEEGYVKRQPSDDGRSPTTSTHNGKRRRRLSFGSWTATDVFGYGKDLLKGLQIGQTESSGIGAVIPVVSDTSTSDGIHHAYSTIRAYCTSHDLLLRGLIVLPSLMNPPVKSSTRQSSSEMHRSSSSQQEKETKAQSGLPSLSQIKLNTTKAALSTDVGEAMDVTASLAPALKSDGGRVIALVPTAFRRWHVDSLKEDNNDELEFNITRRAMLEMWSGLTSKLAHDHIQVSQIHMSSPSPPASSKEHNKSSTTRSPKYQASKKGQSLQSKATLLSRFIFSQMHFILYPVPCKVTSLKEHTGENDEVLCPSLLLEAVRSALVRSWPRRHYYVGLGPRLENIWESIPGHSTLLDWIQSRL
jgi:hypothetical protein